MADVSFEQGVYYGLSLDESILFKAFKEIGLAIGGGR